MTVKSVPDRGGDGREGIFYFLFLARMETFLGARTLHTRKLKPHRFFYGFLGVFLLTKTRGNGGGEGG